MRQKVTFASVGPARGRASTITSGSAVDLGLRPDAISVTDSSDSAAIPARIVVVEHPGGSSLLYVDIDNVDGLVTVEQRGKSDLPQA